MKDDNGTRGASPNTTSPNGTTASSRIVTALVGVWGVLWVLIGAVFLVQWLEFKQLVYRQPEFELLRVSRGTLLFRTQWRSSGGYAVIQRDNGSDITLTCGGPYHEQSCYHIREGNAWIAIRSEVSGKTATVWWFEHPGGGPADLLYQMEVDGKLVYQYAEQADKYLKEYRRGPPNSPLIMMSACLLLAVPSIKRLVFRKVIGGRPR